ncbi:toprim domain-containing protein [Flavobacterium sp. N2820]|uniref:toprim domain-containing protein n=1 Tax=Flavobacterium sp. N2820 TaxID=2986834 RepID=UPI00222407F3|nr:toprim domain-containing protein [Flavobacterium sp. N2820]
MFTKVENNLKFNTKRNFKIVTPCCHKTNTDGKFVNYLDYEDYYGFCHSCGVSTMPPTIYLDENGEEFTWSATENKFIRNTLSLVAVPVAASYNKIAIPQKFIPEEEIWSNYYTEPENNLLRFLRKNYNEKLVEDAKEVYAISTSKDGGTMFWNINKALQIQKLKIVYYDENGRRKNHFKVPYKNEDGYFSCLFGEHLLSYISNQKKTVILVESEKTAIIGYMLMPKYIWLAYGGCNGLTNEKTKVLKDFKVLIIPDMSENAVLVATKKVGELRLNGIDIKLWDMTEGKNDEQLKQEGIYNNDLEDFFRELKFQ